MDESSVPSLNLTDNSSSPYFLHHGDNPGIILVSQLLTGDNYNSWSRSMKIALRAKNKLGFIDGSLPLALNSTTRDNPTCDAWLRCNDMVFSWILNSVSKNIAASCIYIDTAAALWADLKERFSQSNRPRIFQLQKEISFLLQGDMSDPLLG